MRRPAAVFTIALALGAMILVPRSLAQAQNAPEEGPKDIEKCRTIDKPGSYKLVNNLTFTGSAGTCLNITADSVTIDLAGFTISGPGDPFATTTAIAAGNDRRGITVRSGSISGFREGVVLEGDGSIVEGLRVFDCFVSGIVAKGIVRGNTAVGIFGFPGQGTGISATGTVTSNYVTGSRVGGIAIGQGSTVIGNTATGNFVSGTPGFGISVDCPSNLTDNTAVNNRPNFNLLLNGDGCHSEDNLAP
jgi:hypothetical protein